MVKSQTSMRLDRDVMRKFKALELPGRSDSDILDELIVRAVRSRVVRYRKVLKHEQKVK